MHTHSAEEDAEARARATEDLEHAEQPDTAHPKDEGQFAQKTADEAHPESGKRRETDETQPGSDTTTEGE